MAPAASEAASPIGIANVSSYHDVIPTSSEYFVTHYSCESTASKSKVRSLHYPNQLMSNELNAL